MASGYSRQQWMVLISLLIVNFCNMSCASLQGPFFPAEATRRGATATQYGLVFSIFHLVIFIVSLFYGKYIDVIGLKFMYKAGVFITSLTCILFGTLNFVIGTNQFIGLALFIRIIEALGTAAIRVVSYSFIAKEFPNEVGRTFAKLQTANGLGLIAGPFFGGFIYEIGGFWLPFVVLGIVLIIAGGVTVYILPGDSNTDNMVESSVDMLAVIKIPSIVLFIYITIASSFSIAFQSTYTDQHLMSFDLSPSMLCLVFIIQGATYAITAPLWGCLCDKKMPHKVATLIGGLFIVLAFLLFGPAPYIPFPNTLWGCIISLGIFGVGLGGEHVGAFSGMLEDTYHAGYPKTTSTYGLVAGIFNSAFSLGFFFGPTVCGPLIDIYGFRWASMMVVAMHLIVVGGVCVYFCCHRQFGVSSVYNELAVDKEKLSFSSVVANTSNGGIGACGGIGETKIYHETTKRRSISIGVGDNEV